MNARTSRRLMTTAATVILAAGIVTVVVVLSGSGAARPVRRTVAGLASCRSAQLAVHSEWGGVGMGTIVESAVFTNVSSSRCSLAGYPRLQMLNAAGARLPTLIRHGGPAAPIRARPVPLTPGAHASFYITFENSTGFGSASCPTSALVRITPPGDKTPISIPWRLNPYGGSTIARLRCGEIMVSPVVSGVRRRR